VVVIWVDVLVRSLGHNLDVLVNFGSSARSKWWPGGQAMRDIPTLRNRPPKCIAIYHVIALTLGLFIQSSAMTCWLFRGCKLRLFSWSKHVSRVRQE
jgi:hypothetical protein